MYLFIVYGYKQFNNICFNNNKNSLKSIFLSGQQDASYRRYKRETHRNKHTHTDTHTHTHKQTDEDGASRRPLFFLSLTLKLPSLRIGLVRHAKLQVRKLANSLSVDFPQRQSSSNILYISGGFVSFTIFTT